VLINVSERKSLESKDQQEGAGQLVSALAPASLIKQSILKTCFFLWLCLAELLLLQRTAVLQGMLYHIVSCVMASEMERPVDPTSTQRNSAKFVTKDLDAIPGERSKLVQGSVCMLAQPQRTHDIFRKFHRLSRTGHFTFFRSLRLAKPSSSTTSAKTCELPILSEMCFSCLISL